MSAGSRARVALLLTLTFVAGMAAGVATDRLFGFGADRPAESDRAERAEDPKQARDDHRRDRRGGGTTIERFADELGLTEEQRARIDPILEDTRERMSELFEPVRPAYRDLVDTARTQIEAILTPEQVIQYRQLLDRDYGDDHDRERDGRTEGDTEPR